jgi:hypothetical protein
VNAAKSVGDLGLLRKKMDLKETDEGTWKQTSVSNGPIWYHMPQFQLFWDSEGSLSSKSDIQLVGVLDT